MNYRDVALLNQSIDDLGRSLLQKKMLAQQDENTDADRALRERSLDEAIRRTTVDDERMKAALTETQRHNAATEDERAISRINGMYATFQEGVAKGFIEPEFANKAMAGALANIPQEKRQAILSNTPLGVFEAGGGFKAPQAPATGVPNEMKVNGGSIYYTDGRWQFVPEAKAEKPDQVKITRDAAGQESVSGTETALQAFDARKKAAANPPPKPPGALDVGGGITIGNPRGQKFGSAEEVRDAMRAGKLSGEQAKAILQSQFGYK